MNYKTISDIGLIEEETLAELEKEAKKKNITFKELINQIDGRRFYFKHEGWTRKNCSLFTKKRYFYFKKKGYGPVRLFDFKNLYLKSEN